MTGASSGIGYELAKLCVGHGHDLVIAADEPSIERAEMIDTKVGQGKKADPASVAKTGFDAMMGEGDVAGLTKRIRAAVRSGSNTP